MRRFSSHARGTGGAVLLTLLAGGCANTQIAPHTAGEVTTLEPEERAIWKQADEETTTLDHSRFRADLPEVDAYLDRVIARLAPAPLPNGGNYRARVLVDPTLNAFVLPNGAIYIHSGLLARLENEAQLAAVLGHELTHATNRHSLRSFRKTQNATAFNAGFTVATIGVGALFSGIGAMASLSGYSKDLELEADHAGFTAMVAAGYDPRESTKAYEVFVNKIKTSKQREPYFFGSHPRMAERIENFQRFVAELPAEKRRGEIGTEAYVAILPSVLRLDAEAAISTRDFEQTEADIKRLIGIDPRSIDARLLAAELRRKRGNTGDAEEARRLFESLTKDHPEIALAWRGLGFSLYHAKDVTGASESFKRYLTLAPGAPDRAHIQTLILP